MKNTMKFFVLIAFIFAGFAASAQSAIKLGHLDTDKLLSVMPEFKNFQAEMQKKVDSFTKELDGMRAEFQKQVDEYQRTANTLSDLVRSSKEETLQRMSMKIDEYRSNADTELEKARNELMAPILEKVKKAITEVGKENNFTYIFAAGGLLFAADNSLDVMPLVKKKLGIQ